MRRMTLLCGPPGSGKTRRVVDLYVRRAEEQGDDAVALLVPSLRAAALLSARIASHRACGGLFDPRIFTFPALAETLLDANGEPVRRLTDLQRHLVLRDLVSRLQADGKLGGLSALAGFEGFLEAVDGLISELKRAAVDPARFSELVRRHCPEHPANEGISALYEAYQRVLTTHALYDDAGAFWQARDLLAEGRRRPLENVSLLLVDGFEDFTTTQLQVVELLSREVDQVVVTLRLRPESQSEAYALPQATRRRLREHLPELQEEWLGDPAPPWRSSLEGLRHCWMDLEAPPDLIPDDSVALLAAPGVRAEAREVARQVKGRLLEGVAPGDIAVLVRSLDVYHAPLVEAFAEFGVPCRVGVGRPLNQCPAAQTVLDILDVPAGDYQREDVVKLLCSSYVARTRGMLLAGTQWEARIGGDELEDLALRIGVIGGAREWTRLLSYHRNRLAWLLEPGRLQEPEDEDGEPRRSREDLEAEAAALEQAQRLLNGLFELLNPLMAASTPAHGTAALAAAVDALGVARCAQRADDLAAAAADTEALRLLFEALQEWVETAPEIGLTQPLQPGEFVAAVRELCRRLSLAPAPDHEGAVRVMDVYEARQLRFPEVFVVGLNEGVFPQARHADAIYDDDARARLNREGTVLEQRLPRQSEEALLFLEALSAAEKRLWLSWATCDADGGPLLCSHFLEEVQRLFSPPLVPRIRRLSQVISEPFEAACPRELLESALDRDAAPGGARAAAFTVLRSGMPQVLAHAQRSADMEAERDSPRPPGAWDGVIGDPDLQALLAAEFGADRHFSPSSLGAYGTCPMGFFCGRVLGLQELEEPKEEVSARDLGEMIHRILAQFFAARTKGQDAYRSLTEEELPAEQERMAQIVRRVFAEREGLVPHRRLWEVVREQVAQDMAALLALEAQDGTRKTWAVEQVYGRDGNFRVSSGGESILLEGRIDRVDVLEGEGVGFVVLDYKSGDGQGAQAIKDGTDFQLPVYALAAQETVFAGHGAQCAGWAYYRVRHPVGIRNGVGAMASSRDRGPTVEELLDAAREHMIAHVQNIRRGYFPMLPAGDVCGYCAFRWVCRFEPRRMARKLGGQGVEA